MRKRFFAFKDLKINKQISKFKDWFENIDFSKNNKYNDGFSYEGWAGHYDLVKFNLKNQEVRNYLFGAVEMWIDFFDIDGLRLDAADCIDLNFLSDLRILCNKKKNDFWLMGEIVHGDYRKWANESVIHSVTNYECFKGLYSSHNDENYFEIAYSMNRLFGENGIYRDLYLYNFVDNHDVNRLFSTLKNKNHVYLVYILLYTMNGVPSVYYGSEFCIEGLRDKFSDKMLRPALNLNDIKENSSGKNFVHFIKKLSEIRKQNEPLKYGTYNEIYVSNKQYAFERVYQNESVKVLLNLSGQESVIKLKNNDSKIFFDILNNEDVSSSAGEIIMKPYSGRVLTEKSGFYTVT